MFEKDQQVTLRITCKEQEEIEALKRAILNAIIATSLGIMQMNARSNRVTNDKNM